MQEDEDHAQQRLREGGWSALTEVDLLALFLAPGNSSPRALRLAVSGHSRLGSLRRLRDISFNELVRFGLSPKQALALLASREIWKRCQLRPLPPDSSFRSSSEVVSYFRPLLSDLQKECFWVLLLDGKNRIVRVLRVSEGCLTRSIVHPREVFRPAIREGAVGVLFVHNHPSGLPEPSREDLEITRRLVETGKVVGIRVLDHVIIGAYRYYSFADEGML